MVPKFIEIIIPVRNEAGNLAILLRRLDKALRSQKISYRAVFIDDRSTDKSVQILKKLAQKYPLEIYPKIGLPGKAYSILEGAKYCHGEFLAMLDGDLQYPPEKLPEMLAKVTPNTGVIVAHRRIRETGGVRSFFSKLNHKLFNVYLHHLPFDIQSGMKVFRTEIINHLSAQNLDPWALDLPLLLTARHLGYTIAEVDIEFAERVSGQSKINFVNASWQIARTSLKHKFAPAKIYPIVSTHPSHMLGAGIAHKGQRYITHTHLERHHSAVETLVGWQRVLVLDVILLLVLLLVMAPITAVSFFIALLSAVYFFDVFFNFYLVSKSLHFPPEITLNGKLKIENYPTYSILCPLYRESRVLPHFVKNIDNLDWPKDKLDVLLLLEENDTETIEAARRMYLPKYFRTIIVPHSFPKTKPKACNYGLIFAKGEYTVIYDAEDRPDPDQLKKAYLAFQKTDAKTVCLQAKLNYYNPRQNLLTRLFTAEYSLWFDVTLPGLQTLNTALPLGGTSNHFRTSALRDLRGWDAFNVTEDCDLGARLFKLGYKTAMIDSTTWEEANSRLGNWIRQRSRWIKGYIQTYFVHNRSPLTFVREHGIHALYFQLIVGGKIAFMIINPILWIMTLGYFLAYQLVGPTIESLYPSTVFYLAGFSAVFGNFMFFYFYMLGLAKRGAWEHIKFTFLIPFYWIFISFAALKAFIQLLYKPHYWEKTHHGLHLAKPAVTRVPAKSRSFTSFRFPQVSQYLPAKVLSGGFLIGATIAANGLNFIYNAYLGRQLSLEDFGMISLVGSFFYITQLLTVALSKSISHKSAVIYGRIAKPAFNFWHLNRTRFFKISLAASVVWIISTPFLAVMFHAKNAMPFLLFSPVWIIGIIGAIDRGFLTGIQKFTVLGTLSLIEAATKLIFAYLFVSTDLSSYVYAAIPLSIFLSFMLGWKYLSRFTDSAKPPELDPKALSFPTKFFFSSFAVRLSTLAFLSMDLIVVKIFLNPVQAGQYALLSLIGKMVYLASGFVSQFTIPLVSYDIGAGKNHTKTFNIIFILITVIGLSSYFFLGLAGKTIVPLLFGNNTLDILNLLPTYTLGIVMFTLATELVTYNQMRHRDIFPALGFLSGILLIVSLSKFHTNLDFIVKDILVVGLFYLTSVFALHLLYPLFGPIASRLNIVFTLLKFAPNNNRQFSPGRKRILILNWRDTSHKWAGGAEVYIHELAKKWAKSGHNVIVFCSNDGRNSPEEIIDGVHVIRRGNFITVYIWAAIMYLFMFRQRVDMIIDSENGIPFFSPLYTFKPTYLLIHHIHQDALIYGGRLPFVIARLAMFLESKLMPLVYRNQKIITVSKSSQNDILKLGLGKKAGVEIISPGIDLAQFSPGIKTNYPSFLYLGRIRPYKNLDVAIKAFTQVNSIYPEARLNIAGWGEGIKELKQLVANLHLTHVIKFHEKVSETEKKKLLKQSWVMLQPSSFEGWGITVIEAAASGTPTIASNVVGLRDSVINQETGLLVPVKNPSAMANSMVNLIKNPSRLRKLSQNSITWAREYDWNIQSKKFMEIISEPNSKGRLPNVMLNLNLNEIS